MKQLIFFTYNLKQTEKLDRDWYSLIAHKQVSVRGKIKLLTTLSIQQPERMLTYTFNDQFELTRHMLLNVIINMGTTIMLIFQSQNRS